VKAFRFCIGRWASGVGRWVFSRPQGLCELGRPPQSSTRLRRANAQRPMHCPLLALVFLAQTAGLFAAELPKVMPAARDTVIVPYDPKKPLKEQTPDKVYLAHERFLELWEAAKRNRAGEKQPPAAMSFALGAAIYEGRVQEKRVTFKATIELSTFNGEWVRVPLPFRGMQFSELSLDGKPAALVDGALIVEKPGKHAVTAVFEIPLEAGAREFGWGIPQTAATKLMLTIPEKRWRVKVQPDAGVIERISDGRLIVSAALGTTAEVRVALVEREADTQTAAASLVQITTAIAVSPAHERALARIESNFPGGQQDKFSVVLSPPGTALVALVAPGLRSWNLREDARGQVLDIALNEPVKERYSFTVTTERALPANLPAESAAMWFDAGGKRSEFVQELHAEAGVDVTVLPQPALRQTERNLQRIGDWTPVGAWTGREPLKYRIALAASKQEAHVDYVYQVNRRKIELIASMKLEAKGTPLFDAALTLPADFEVQAVDSERLLDWWRDGQKLRVRFKGATPEMTPLVVYLVREYAAAPQQLAVQPLALDGFAKVSGEAVIAAHKGVDAMLKLAVKGDANPANAGGDPAKEIDPAKAAPDFQILPPLERKRGFAFRNQSFAGEVTLAALPVKQTAMWVMHAQAFEAWASLSLKAQLTLRQGSIESSTFSLPATLPEAHVSGAEVRETRSRVVGDRRIYDVAFQNDVYESVDFTVDVDVTMAEGKRPDGRRVNEFSLPAPEFPEAQLVTGYVLADNASEYEMKLDTDGVEQTPTAEIPWLPTLTKGAGVFRVQPKWKVAFAMERLEKAETRTAFCAWAEMTTALRNDGTEWHKAVWHLQNRSLQFLPVKLPDGSALVGARVAGQAVRADTGIVDGRPVILIPLIKTKPGDVSYDVEVVWRQPGSRLAPSDRRKLRNAELVGITVEQTFWNVWLPDDRPLTKSGGNMEEVIAVQREIEKAKSEVEELIALNSILADGNVSSEVWFNAKRNWDATCRMVETRVLSNGGVLQRGRYSSAAEPGGLNKQGEATIGQLDRTNKDLGEQISKLTDDNRRIQQKMQGRMANAGGNANNEAQVQMQGNAAQTLLFGNNTYTGATTINARNLDLNGPAQTMSGAGNSQGGSTIVNGGTLNLNGNAGQGDSIQNNQRWTMNPSLANSAAQTENAAPSQGGAVQNFYLNDNVVLQQAKGKEMSGKVSKTGTGQLAAGSAPLPQSATQSTVIPATTNEAAPAAGPALEKKADEMAVVENVRGLNVARGNRLQQLEQAQTAMPRPENPAVPMQTAQPPPVPKPSEPAVMPPLAMPTQAVPGLDASGVQSANGIVFGQGQGNVSRRDAGAILQPQGRLSLAVDFPTEGRVYHFQKVKANALLELSFADPKIVRRRTRTAVFAGLAIILWLMGRFFSGRRTRRAV